MKAAMSIDPELIQMLGRKLYRNHPVVIAVRELLQNSVDACKTRGVIPHIRIDVFNTPQGVSVVCEDNGIGMTEDDIINNFLCLGGSSKRGTDAAGKFGIAKAAIMSGVDWWVESLDNLITKDDLIQGNDIQKVKKLDGTRVTIQFETCSEWQYKDYMFYMIYGSDVDIEFNYGQTHKDKHAGFHNGKTCILGTDMWSFYGSTSVRPVPQVNLGGRAFVRLNGLVQYPHSYGLSPNTVYFADIENAPDPSSKEYPFTVSREGLTGNLGIEVEKLVQEHKENPVTSDAVVSRQFEDNEITFIPGRMCVGTQEIEQYKQEQATETHEVFEKWVSEVEFNIRHKTNPETGFEKYINPKSSMPLMRLRSYTPQDEYINEDSKIIVIWSKILEAILPEELTFGVGAYGPENASALLDEEANINFFLINPLHVRELETPQEKVMSLWISACHEAAHLSYRTHNELFVITNGVLLRKTAAWLLSELPYFTRMIGD